MAPWSFLGPFALSLPLLLAYLAGVGAGIILLARGQRAAGTMATIGFVVLAARALLSPITALSPLFLSGTMPAPRLGVVMAGITFASNLVAALAVLLIVVALLRAAMSSDA